MGEAQGQARGQEHAGVVHELEVRWGSEELAELAELPHSARRWVRDLGRDLPGLVDGSFAALGGIAG